MQASLCSQENKDVAHSNAMHSPQMHEDDDAHRASFAESFLLPDDDSDDNDNGTMTTHTIIQTNNCNDDLKMRRENQIRM